MNLPKATNEIHPDGAQELKGTRLEQMFNTSDIPQAYITFGEDGIVVKDANSSFNDFVAQLFNKDYQLAIEEFKKSIVQWDINHQELFPFDISVIDGYK